MISQKEKEKFLRVCNTVLIKRKPLSKIAQNLGVSCVTVRVYISKAIVLGFLSDTQVNDIIDILCRRVGYSSSTNEYYNYVLAMREQREKLRKRYEFLKYFCNKNSKDYDNYKRRLEELNKELKYFEKSNTYKYKKKPNLK